MEKFTVEKVTCGEIIHLFYKNIFYSGEILGFYRIFIKLTFYIKLQGLFLFITIITLDIFQLKYV